MTLEDYLKSEMSEGKIDFELRATEAVEGRISFYIHPAGADGKTRDFVVEDNNLSEDEKVESAESHPD